MPQFLKDLDKNMCTVIERDEFQAELRGRAFVSLSSMPNGHYSVYCLRIGSPLSPHSMLKVIGKAKRVLVNFNRLPLHEAALS